MVHSLGRGNPGSSDTLSPASHRSRCMSHRSSRAADTRHLFRTLLPLGVIATAAVALAQGEPREGSVLPGAGTTKPAVTPGKPDANGVLAGKTFLKIVALRTGREPYPWLVTGRVARSFVTNTPQRLQLIAAAEVPGRPEASGSILWEVSLPDGFALPEGVELKGGTLSLDLRRDGGNPTSEGAPLSLTVTATVEVDGKPLRQSMTLTQDLRDRLRQEYIDFQRAFVPERRDLVDEEQFHRLYGKRYPSVGFGELNFSRVPGTEDRYPVILASERLVSALHRIEREYGAALTISSGFRNPVRQLQVHSSVGESHHQYGRAADLYVTPDSSVPKTGRQIAWPSDWLRLAAASLRGGGGWIEPMLACHVNTAGCHVHVDVRERGEVSRIVQLTGQVLGSDGLPLPNAEVRLAGMPARTNASGNFLLKHVLTPRSYELEVEAQGRGVITQPIEIGPVSSTVSVRFPLEPQAALTATAGAVERNAEGEPVVPITVRNLGSAAALELSLQPRQDPPVEGEEPAPGLVKRVWPSRVVTLPPGGTSVFRVAVTLPPGSQEDEAALPALVFTAAYRDGKGEARAQQLTLEWRLRGAPTVQPPAPAPLTTPLPVPIPSPPTVPGNETTPSQASGSTSGQSFDPNSGAMQGIIKDVAAGIVAFTIGALAAMITSQVGRRHTVGRTVALEPTPPALAIARPVQRAPEA